MKHKITFIRYDGLIKISVIGYGISDIKRRYPNLINYVIKPELKIRKKNNKTGVIK